MKKKKVFYLYVWENVLKDHTYGMAFAVATSREEAVAVIAQGNHTVAAELDSVAPEVHPVTEAHGSYVYGGS